MTKIMAGSIDQAGSAGVLSRAGGDPTAPTVGPPSSVRFNRKGSNQADEPPVSSHMGGSGSSLYNFSFLVQEPAIVERVVTRSCELAELAASWSAHTSVYVDGYIDDLSDKIKEGEGPAGAIRIKVARVRRFPGRAVYADGAFKTVRLTIGGIEVDWDTSWLLLPGDVISAHVKSSGGICAVVIHSRDPTKDDLCRRYDLELLVSGRLHAPAEKITPARGRP